MADLGPGDTDARLMAIAAVRAILTADAEALDAVWPCGETEESVHFAYALLQLAATAVYELADREHSTPGEYLGRLTRSAIMSAE